MIPNLFDAALANWIAVGQPQGTTHLISYKPGHPDLVAPSRLAACPCQHAHERLQTPKRIVLPDTPQQAYRKALGHECGRRWANILSTAGHETWVEQTFDAKGLSGHVDIILKGIFPGEYNGLPVEIKSTSLKLANSHFWQATAYAWTHCSQRCALVLDRSDGDVDLVGVWRDPVDFVAHDLRTGSPVTWRGQQLYRISDAMLEEKVALHRKAYENEPEAMRLAGITHTKCVRVDAKKGVAETMCPYWCWSAEVRAQWEVKDWMINLDAADSKYWYPIIKGEW